MKNKHPLKNASLYTLIFTVAMGTLPWFGWEELSVSGLAALLNPFSLAGLAVFLVGYFLLKKRGGTPVRAVGLLLVLVGECYAALLWYVPTVEQPFSVSTALSCLRPFFFAGVVLTLLALAFTLPLWPKRVKPVKAEQAAQEDSEPDSLG